MKPIVILAGFSTAGKSYYCSKIKEAFGDKIVTIDSDAEISKTQGHAHIYDLFLKMGRDQAIKYIEAQEELFLQQQLRPADRPRLIAAGPFLLIRPSWEKVYHALKPYVIHIDVTAETVYENLMKRQAKQKEQSDPDHALFGSWDAGVTTIYEGGKYIPVNKDQAIENIREHLGRATGFYQKFADIPFNSEALRTDPVTSKELLALITNKLGL